MESFVVFNLDELRMALVLPAVERVVRAVYFNPLPDAPQIVLGVVNVQGRVIPVVNMRKRFRLPDRETALTDRLVIAQTIRRTVALAVDSVAGVVEYPGPALVGAGDILPGLKYVTGVAKLDDGLIFIHDLDRFLSLDEEETLDRALATAGGR
jgi:purine-binding chemotaxis protein CheW